MSKPAQKENLRECAERDSGAERRRLKEFKGNGETGADIFCREVQAFWDEIDPFVDLKALESADRLELPADAKRLSGPVSRKDFPRLADALARGSREGAREDVLQGA